WDSGRADFEAIAYSEPKPKTKWISVHTSGRVNFHGLLSLAVNFIPCLLDLTAAVPIVAYVVPAAAAFDLAGNIRADDHVVELDSASAGSLGFEFSAIPASIP
ncbi:hypothetical protein DFQ30_005423, partial [Apophysomyces sp. BC1015]